MAMWPSIMNASLLNGLRSQAHLPPQTWYYVAAVTLSTLNRPHEIPSVLRSALEHAANAPSQHPGDMTSLPGHTTHDRKLFVARRIREGLVKSTAVVGLPKTINALLELKRHTPDELVDQPMAASPTARAVELASVDSNALLHRGETFFSQVYGKIAARVMGQMDRSGTEDLGLTARLFYGYLLSNVTVLDPVETSWVLLAGLIPQDVNPQLKGHLRGSLNNGASPQQVRAVRAAIISICHAAGMRILDRSTNHSWGWREEPANV